MYIDGSDLNSLFRIDWRVNLDKDLAYILQLSRLQDCGSCDVLLLDRRILCILTTTVRNLGWYQFTLLFICFLIADAIPSNKAMRLQICVAMKAMPWYSALPTVSEYMVENGWAKCFARVSDVGWPAYLLYLAIYLVFVEFGIYWMHRELHDIKPLYKYLHATHHIYNKQNTLSPFAGKLSNYSNFILCHFECFRILSDLDHKRIYMCVCVFDCVMAYVKSMFGALDGVTYFCGIVSWIPSPLEDRIWYILIVIIIAF